MLTSTLKVATATVSVYRAMFTLNGDNVQYQPLFSTINVKTKIKIYDRNTFSDMTKQTILSSHRVKSHDILDIHLVTPSLISILGGRIKKAGWIRTEPIRLFFVSVSN